MITTREARLAAETWIRDEAGHYPELVGAVLAGSTRTREPDEPHPPSSDVDVFIFVDAEVPSEILEPHGRLAPRKLAFHGVVLEPSFHNTKRIADSEAVLGDMLLAPIFTNPNILLDTDGKLNALATALKPGLHHRRHAQRRLAQALGAPPGPRVSFKDVPALRVPCWRNAGLAFGVMHSAVAVLVAGLRYPTTRRSLIVAREVLASADREDVADALLQILGSSALSRSEVENLASEANRAYDMAVQVRRTPVVMDWNVSSDARELERAAVREMIDTGYHREALLHLLLIRTAAQGIIENDGDDEVRQSSRIGYQRLLAALGIDSHEAYQARGQALRSFMPALAECCEGFLAQAKGLID